MIQLTKTNNDYNHEKNPCKNKCRLVYSNQPIIINHLFQCIFFLQFQAFHFCQQLLYFSLVSSSSNALFSSLISAAISLLLPILSYSFQSTHWKNRNPHQKVKKKKRFFAQKLETHNRKPFYLIKISTHIKSSIWVLQCCGFLLELEFK